ncbi:hypothetical protein EBZ39_00980 [bacterium]|nr:hypothetical protein [bacterium]
MKHTLLALFLLLTSCTVYTEKQSEALSSNVYATSDSLNAARVDLAYYYSQETIRLVKPPKNRIDIQPVYETQQAQKSQSPVPASTITTTNTRVVMVPEQYKNDKVVVVNSTEYQELLKNKKIADQLKKDNQNVLEAKIATEKELEKQAEMTSKMVKDLNILQKKVVEKDLVILRLWVAIVGLLAAIGGYIYLRVSKLLPF